MYYSLGNDLRGWFSGEFATENEAWDTLSNQFNLAYPSRSGRYVTLKGVLREGQTLGGNERESDRNLREKLEAMLLSDKEKATTNA